MKRLVDNLNSRYYEAYNKLNSKKSRKRIIAYVESFDDVFFWRTVLSSFENDTRYFEIMLPSRNRLTKGKKSVLKNELADKMGEGMIACVDADYDYLLQGCTHTSKEILSSPYVFHTYVYAIENYQCYAPSLHDVCVMATLNDKSVFDFERFFTDYSQLCYPLLIWSIWAYRTQHFDRFSITDMNTVIEMGKVNPANSGYAMHHLEEKVKHKLNWLKHTFPGNEKEIEALTKELTQLGVTPDNTYLYIQGHHLLDNIVSPLIGKVCSCLRNEREEEIRRNAVHYTQMSNELSSYEHSLQDVKQMLRRNTNYKNSPEFQRLSADIRSWLDSSSTSTAYQD